MRPKIEDLLESGGYHKDDMLSLLDEQPQKVDLVIEAMFRAREHAWRAVWVLKAYLRKDDPKLLKRVDQLLDIIPQRPDGFQRESMQLLEGVAFTDEQEGRFFEICLDLWEKVGKTPSVRYTAFKGLVKVIKKYPELINEIQPVLDEEYLEPLSPGVRKGVDKMLSELN